MFYNRFKGYIQRSGDFLTFDFVIRIPSYIIRKIVDIELQVARCGSHYFEDEDATCELFGFFLLFCFETAFQSGKFFSELSFVFSESHEFVIDFNALSGVEIGQLGQLSHASSIAPYQYGLVFIEELDGLLIGVEFYLVFGNEAFDNFDAVIYFLYLRIGGIHLKVGGIIVRKL